MSRLVAILSPVWACVVAEAETSTDSAGVKLDDFLAAAIEYSPRLAVARENRNIEAARRAAASGQLLPQISATAHVTENRRETLGRLEEFRGERYSVQVDQALFDWQAFTARRRAQRLEAMQEAEYWFEFSLTLTEVADRYLGVLQAQDARESTEAELTAVTSQVEQIQSLFDRELAPITDLRRAQAGLSSVRADQVRLRSEFELARQALQAWSGRPVGDLHALGEGAAPPLGHDVEHWVQLAHENNLQIEAGRLAVEAAAAGVSQSKGALLPRLALVALRQNANVGFDNAPIRRTDITYVGVNATMPVFSGGTRLAAIRQAGAIRARAERELHQLELDVGDRVHRTYLQLQAGQSLQEAAAAFVVSTTLSAEAMQQGFTLGTATNVDVLNAIRDRFRAERDLREIRYGNIRQFLQLKHESGTLTLADMAEVSSWFEEPEP